MSNHLKFWIGPIIQHEIWLARGQIYTEVFLPCSFKKDIHFRLQTELIKIFRNFLFKKLNPISLIIFEILIIDQYRESLFRLSEWPARVFVQYKGSVRDWDRVPENFQSSGQSRKIESRNFASYKSGSRSWVPDLQILSLGLGKKKHSPGPAPRPRFLRPGPLFSIIFEGWSSYLKTL